MPLILNRRQLIQKASAGILPTVLVMMPGLADAVAAAQPNVKCIALLIASGQFDDPKITPLDGVDENDIRMMQDLLILKYGFSDITVIGSANATRNNIIAAIQKLVRKMDANTYAVIYFTGHGGQVPDPKRLVADRVHRLERESSEYLITRDCQPIFDFELDHDTSIQAGHITLILDCCHAGGMARAAGVNANVFGTEKFATLPDKILQSILASPLPRKEEFIDSQDQHRVLLAATSKSDVALQIERSAPDQLQERSVGAFTYALYNAVMHSAQPLTNGSVLARTSGILRALLRVEDQNKLPDRFGNALLPAIAPTFSRTVPTQGGKVLPVGWLCNLHDTQTIQHQNGRAIKLTNVKPFRSDLSAPVPDLNLDANFASTYDLLKKVPIKKVSKGDDPASDTIDGIHLDMIPASNVGGYVVVGDTLAGRYSLGTATTKAGASQIMRDQKQSLTLASRIVQSLNGGLSPITESFGLRMGIVGPEAENEVDANPQAHKRPKAVGFPRLREGDTFTLQIQSRRPGNLLLLSCEPDGSINVLYPNQERERVKLTGVEQLNDLIATRPLGITTLVAVESDNDIVLPQELVQKAMLPLTNHSIPREKVDAFLEWLQKAVSRRKEQLPREVAEELSRGTGVLPGARVISLNTVEVSRFSFVTEAANPLPELVKATPPELTAAQRRVLEARPIRLKVTVRANGDFTETLVEGTGDEAVDDAIRESLNQWIWRPGVKIEKGGFPRKIEATVSVTYKYRDGSYTLSPISSD